VRVQHISDRPIHTQMLFNTLFASYIHCIDILQFITGVVCFLVSDLLQCTNEPNVSVPEMANILIERTQNSNWVVVFKSLITVHNLMNYGNEVSCHFFYNTTYYEIINLHVCALYR